MGSSLEPPGCHGRKLRFSVEVTDQDGRTIGVGTHERRVVPAG